jgi:hypothetical protein
LAVRIGLARFGGSGETQKSLEEHQILKPAEAGFLLLGNLMPATVVTSLY